MTSVATWLEDLALLPDIDLKNWKSFRHEHRSRSLEGADVATALSDLGPVSGWLSEPSAVSELHDQVPTPTQRPLAGEFFASMEGGGHCCWLLGYHGRGRWQLDEHTLLPCAAADANCLGQQMRLRHADRPGAHLVYWKLWQGDAEQAPYSSTALLCAIEEGNP